MNKPYNPQADSLPSQVIGYFTNNPEEELLLEDISDKFDCSRGNIHTQLARAVESGMLVRDQNKDGEYIYKAGGNSYLGLLRQATHSHADRAALANVLRDRGHAVKSDFCKIYRRKP